jgi:hypothetical protein
MSLDSIEGLDPFEHAAVASCLTAARLNLSRRIIPALTHSSTPLVSPNQYLSEAFKRTVANLDSPTLAVTSWRKLFSR